MSFDKYKNKIDFFDIQGNELFSFSDIRQEAFIHTCSRYPEMERAHCFRLRGKDYKIGKTGDRYSEAEQIFQQARVILQKYGGRPKKDPCEKKTERIYVRLTKEELEELKTICERTKFSLSELVVYGLKNAKVPNKDATAELLKISGQLQKISNYLGSLHTQPQYRDEMRNEISELKKIILKKINL